MKKSRLNASDRHTQLIELLKKRSYCSVVEMSQLLNVSPMTIRRDLHMQHEANCLCGPQAIAALQTLNINKLFLSASGLLLLDGLSCNNLADAEVKQALIKSSRKTILCMDSSKIGKVYLARFAPLNSIDVLITDNGISDESREAIEQQQIEIITVSAEVPASLSEFELIRDNVAV